jgi:type IV secretory pathway TraG/TraD family ATPase VirD4
MLSQPATKIFFKTSEPRAAKWISEAIGEVEVERLKESRSMDLMSMRSSKSYAMEIAVKPLVMASEISGLGPLRAFIKQENRVVPVWFRLTEKHNKQPEFIERKRLAIAPRPVEAWTAATTPPKNPAESVPSPEAALRFDAPAANSEDDDERKGRDRSKNNEEDKDKNKKQRAGQAKEGFLWDESKGID